MKKYKYITIVIDGEHNEKIKYHVINNKTKRVLGVIYYHQSWKQYVFTQAYQSIIFNNICLKDIVDFIENECK